MFLPASATRALFSATLIALPVFACTALAAPTCESGAFLNGQCVTRERLKQKETSSLRYSIKPQALPKAPSEKERIRINERRAALDAAPPDITLGNPGAPVVVVLFPNPDDRMSQEQAMLVALKKEYIDRGLVKLQLRLSSGRMSEKLKETEAALRCAAAEDRLMLYLARVNSGKQNVANADIAAAAGIDRDRFVRCSRQQPAEENLKVNREIFERLDLQARPAVLINGRLLEDKISFDRVSAAIDRELNFKR